MKSLLKVFAAGGAMVAALAFAGGPAQAESVVASYYGDELAGNPTASGEPFDPSAMTAAHPSLPFGTQLEVCYQGCATVTVNDRGPYVGGRGLDLSQGAADVIGLTGAGVATIEMNVVGSGGGTGSSESSTAPSETASTGGYETVSTGGYVYDPYTGTYYYVTYVY